MTIFLIGLSVVVAGAASFWLLERKAAKVFKKSPEPPAAPAPQRPEVKDAAPATLSEALRATREGFFGRLQALFSPQKSEAGIEEIEELLYMSDLGPHTVRRLLEKLDEKIQGSSSAKLEQVRVALKDEMLSILNSVHSQAEVTLETLDRGLKVGTKPRVWMVVGVNGVGKTTSIGKLAAWGASQGHKVLVAAGDTFRAAAGEQLRIWSERAKVEIFAPEGNAKPSGIAFDACQKAIAQGFDLVIIDTAGRLHTQVNLMEELKKVKKIVEKVMPGAPHEVLLVLDANAGQNALIQAREFHLALNVTGVIMTKLDGSAKGGVIVGLANELQLPVRAIGVGEKIQDLRPFSAKEFVDSIL